ncbi:MAG: carboxymuconolactone decarboxylase family protein [Bacillota bacterium]
MEKSERYRRGLEKSYEFMGHKDNGNVDALGDLGHYIMEFVFGDIYSREGLPLRDRRIVALSMLAVTGSTRQLKDHIKFALNAGFSPKELEEIMIMATVYGGCPTGWSAVSAFYESLKEWEAAPRSPDGAE